MSDLTIFITSIFGSWFDAIEFWATKLLWELPNVFGLSFGAWILLFMVVGIILGDFIDG